MTDNQEIITPINIRADHNAPVRGIPLNALLAVNTDSTDSYGADQYTEELHTLLETALGFSVHMALASTGTQANILALDALKYVANDPGTTVITPNMAHIVNHEAGIVAAKTGMGIIRLPSIDGRFQPEILDKMLLHRPDDTVFEQPKIIAITNPTEIGAVWQPDAIKELADYCHTHGLLLFIDGARAWNAAAKIGYTNVADTLNGLYQYADAFTIGIRSGLCQSRYFGK